MMAETNNQKSMLLLVRLALGGGANDVDWSFDWQYLFEASHKQGVSAMLTDAVNELPADKRPEMSLLLQWIGRTTVMERTYAQHREAIAQLASFYAQHGIRMMLMKGYGCSISYPVPQHRPTGDIDIYLFGKQQEADEIMEREYGVAVHREYHKHSTFPFLGFEVENHAKFIDDVSHKSNIRFEKTLMEVLRTTECVASDIENVLLPSATFNALFLLRHTGEHFASNEITLRHVLDVGTFFSAHHADVDWTLVHAVLQQEGMTEFYDALATICVDQLGMSSSDFHGYTPRHDLARRILQDIFEEKEALPMSTYGISTIGQKLRYGIGKTRRWWRNRWKYRMVYNENLAESFVWLARNRMK
jgi:hypothetical protein